MKEFDRRLKNDALTIDAEVSAEWRARMDASLRATKRLPAVAPQKRAAGRLWLASSLTGVASALVIIAVMNWNRHEEPPAPEVAALPRTVPEHVATSPAASFLDIRTAEFTEPLEEELQHLQSDLEKARRNMRRDLEFAF